MAGDIEAKKKIVLDTYYKGKFKGSGNVFEKSIWIGKYDGGVMLTTNTVIVDRENNEFTDEEGFALIEVGYGAEELYNALGEVLGK